MSDGFVKLSRKIRINWMLTGDHDALAVFVYLLTSATHRAHKLVVDGNVVELLPGQVLGGRRRIADACGLSEKQVRRILKLLENAEIVAKEPANGRAKGVSLITLVNWELYQSATQERAKEPANGRAMQGPSKGQARATDKNGKKGKNENMGGESASKSRPTSPQEVTEYAKSIGFDLDGQYFIDYQDARGWKMKGGQAIKDWRACVRTWKRRSAATQPVANNDGPHYRKLN